MPRPRKVSDEEVYAAAMRVMERVGPAELTLARIAAEAGVTAGALVQRFGSKRQLLVTMSSGLAADMSGFFADLRRRHRAPLQAVREYAACMAGLARTPAALLRNLAYLQVDLADPDIRAHLVAQSQSVQAELAALLHEARRRRELTQGSDIPALVRNIEALISGALLTWAFHTKGDARSWLLAHVDALLQPHLTPAGARSLG